MRRANLSIALVLAAGLAGPANAAVIYRDVDQLTTQATQIVIGDVVDLQCFRNDQGMIRSRITVQATDYLLGQGSGVEILEMDGGTVGDTTLSVSVLPVFAVGDHVLLFLDNRDTRLVEAFQGAYLTDGRQVVRMAPGCRRIMEESIGQLSDMLTAVARALPAGAVLAEPQPYEGPFSLPLAEPRYSLCNRSWAYMTNPMGENYVINANCSDAAAGDAASQRTQIQNGAAAWTNAGAHFEFTYGGSSSLNTVNDDGTNLVFFSNTPPGAGDYVAVTYSWSSNGNITECDLCFNDRDYTFWNGSGSCSGMMDIWDIATHEFGHFLCLADLYGASDYMKTMYGYVDVCDIHARDLSTDDINGIIAIYGLHPGPANDYCSNATVITGNGTYTGSTVYATTDGSSTCGSSSASPDVWYRYTPSTVGTLVLNMCASAYDTAVSIHTGCPGVTTNQVGGSSGCNDDSNTCGTGSSQSYLSVAVTANTTYYIRVTGYLGAEGDYSLLVSGPAPDSTAPTPNPMTFNASPSGLPAATSTSQIAMTATTATDASGGIQYYFTAVGTGGHSSSWQTDRTYTDTGLTTNTNYSYKVKARDIMLNETGDSAVADVATFIETPIGLTIGTTTDTSIQATALDTFSRLNTNLSGLFFEVTTQDGTPVGGAAANAWVQTTTITASGLTPNTTYRFRVKARNYFGQNETAWYPTSGYVTQTTGTADLTPPSPNPMTFDVVPAPISTSQITMTATQASDPSGGVQYYFTATGVGSHTSGWVTSRVYTDTTLQTNRYYSYKVKARDALHNETTDSIVVPVATFIETPTALSFGTITDNTIPVTAPGTFTRLTSNLSGMFFEVTKLDGTPVGGTQANAWVQVQSITAAGLTAGTTYRFRVKARNYYGANETPWYPTSGYITRTTTGGAVCTLLGDVNGDGVRNGLDVDGFVRAKLGAAPLEGENQACANYGGTLDQDIADFVADLLGV